MSNNKIKFNAIQMIDGEDNIFHNSVTEDVDFISVPIETNNLSNTEDPHPKVLDTIKQRLEFKGNIHLSESGKSWNIWRNTLNNEDDMVEIDLSATPF